MTHVYPGLTYIFGSSSTQAAHFCLTFASKPVSVLYSLSVVLDVSKSQGHHADDFLSTLYQQTKITLYKLKIKSVFRYMKEVEN
jgi:hypothetical protein